MVNKGRGERPLKMWTNRVFPLPVCAAGPALRLWPSFVHPQLATLKLFVIQLRDCGFGLLVVWHLHEAETAGTSGVAVHNDVYRIYLSVRFEQTPQGLI